MPNGSVSQKENRHVQARIDRDRESRRSTGYPLSILTYSVPFCNLVVNLQDQPTEQHSKFACYGKILVR